MSDSRLLAVVAIRLMQKQAQEETGLVPRTGLIPQTELVKRPSTLNRLADRVNPKLAQPVSKNPKLAAITAALTAAGAGGAAYVGKSSLSDAPEELAAAETKGKALDAQLKTQHDAKTKKQDAAQKEQSGKGVGDKALEFLKSNPGASAGLAGLAAGGTAAAMTDDPRKRLRNALLAGGTGAALTYAGSKLA